MTMGAFKALTLAAVTWLATGATAFADVQLTIGNGRVSLVAKDATVRQILAEWARVGQTKIVNVERIPGGPVTLELKDVSEQQALDVLLRSVSGYMAAPRAAGVINASAFDRIIVMPASRAPVAVAASPPVVQQPALSGQFGQLFQPPADENSADEPPSANVTANRGPVFNQPLRGGLPAAEPPRPATYPAAAQPTSLFGGAAVPGVIVQPVPQPGQAPPR